MLQVARLAPTLLQSSADLVGAFFRERYDPAGGFTNRAGLPDLYYTVFGLEGLAALRAPIDADRTRAYLRGFGDGAALDFVDVFEVRGFARGRRGPSGRRGRFSCCASASSSA